MIANIDDNVGKLLARLKEWDLERGTLVIFVNDNGGTAGLKIYNAGMRSGKNTPYHGGTRAASFWRWPGTIDPGDVSALAAHIDIFRTLAEFAGAKIPVDPASKLDGRNLAPLLKDAHAPWPERYLFTHVGRWEKNQAEASKYRGCSVHSSGYIMVSSSKDGRKNWELYDLQADPSESNNVIDSHPEMMMQMDLAYDRWWEEILPNLENENAVGPQVNPFKELYWKQFGGGAGTLQQKPIPEAP